MFYLRHCFCLSSRNQHFQVVFSSLSCSGVWFSDLFLFSRYNLIDPSKESLLLHSQIRSEGGHCKNVMRESLGCSLPLTCTDWHPLGHSLSVSNPLADILMLGNPPRSGTSCSLSPPPALCWKPASLVTDSCCKSCPILKERVLKVSPSPFRSLEFLPYCFLSVCLGCL